MNFIDCYCSLGLPLKGQFLRPAAGPKELLKAMDKAGIGQALVWHLAQRDWSPLEGNAMLERMIRPYRNLFGTWALLPRETDEIPAPDQLIRKMARTRIRSLIVFPAAHRFVLCGDSLGDYLEEAVRRRIPLILSGSPWEQNYSLLREFPRLTCIIADVGIWGSDRFFRPLIAKYPNVHIEISSYILDGGIESFVKRYGAERMLFGSGFPAYDHGGVMLALRHARISEKDKAAIAAGNMQRILDQEDFS